MPDPGFVSGFISVGIDMVIRQILDHINIALRRRKELANLKHLLMEIEPIIKEIQHYRLDLNRKKIPIPQSNNKLTPSAVNIWLKQLATLLQRASAMAHQCTSTIPRYDVVSRYKSSRRITRLISDITQHLQLVPLIGLVQSVGQTLELRETLGRVDELGASSSSAITSSATTIQPASRGFFINEPLIVGQHNAFATLENSVIEAEAQSSFSRIGVLGKGGSGKTLLLKTVFNSKKVRDFFCNGLLLWLTVSQFPSFTSLRNQLSFQIAMQTKINPDKNMNEEAIKIWLHESMQAKRFALFLDDVWEEGARLLEELGLLRLTNHSSSKIVVSSRNHKALLEMGVNADVSTLITMGDLTEDDSWRLFVYHAFPHNNGNLPGNIEEGKAKVVCTKCGGHPLSIKVVGRALAGTIDAQEWDLAVQRLQQGLQPVYDCLRLSYDALGNYNVNLQLCFVYLAAAFPEDEIIYPEAIIILWLGEGLLQDQAGHDLFEIGRIYISNLADRCLIEPTVRNIDGRVQYFRMHDVVRSSGLQIAEQEENFYCGVGKALTTLDANECLGCTRISLTGKQLTFLAESFRAPEICTLSLYANKNLREIPRRVIGSMISLKVLDLSNTSIQSLPERIGCLRQLVCLRLLNVPIEKLPASLTNLASLEILDLCGSRIRELPSGIYKLRALKYLSLFNCDELQCLPHSMSRLTSLQILFLPVCSGVWTNHAFERGKKWFCIDDLENLTQLQYLRLNDNGETMSEGILGRMAKMQALELKITMTTSLPKDIINMSMLKRFSLKSSHIVKIESKFCEFQYLYHLRLWDCNMLEELPHLHNLRSLMKLEIIRCSRLKKISKEFGETGAFPMLKILSMVNLDELEELPIIEEGAMPKLKNFILMLCEALMMLPESYLNLKTLKKIRVYGCSKVLENLQMVNGANTNLEVVTMSTPSTKELSQKYYQELQEDDDDWGYDEFWNNEFYLFLQEICRYF